MSDRRKGHLNRVRCKWKITSINFLSIVWLVVLEEYIVLLKLVSAQNTTESPANVTCEPVCDRNYFCNVTDSRMNVSNEAHCVSCFTICPNASQSEVGHSKFCQQKCPGMLFCNQY